MVVRGVGMLVMVGLAVGAVAGCTSEQRKSINETVARNAIAVAGIKEFRDHDHPVDGVLDCTVKSKSTTRVTVACTGTTKDGQPVTLVGTTKDARQLEGSFVGTVAGKQVFSTDCLAC